MKFRTKSFRSGLNPVACAAGTNKCIAGANGIADFSDSEEVTHEKLFSVHWD